MERPDLENVAAKDAWEIARYALALEAQLAGVWALMEGAERLRDEAIAQGLVTSRHNTAASVFVHALRAVLDALE